jgi:hypothetical protein
VAELSVDEAQRLARQFLTGMASPADVSRVSNALADDSTLALELLSQMQAALDDVAPSALNAEQDRSVDSRIEALIGPRIKKRGFFGWFKKLFGRKPKRAEEPAPSRRRKRGSEPAAAAPLPEPSLPAPSAGGGDDMMEEMVPIASSPAEGVPADAAPPEAKAAAKPAAKKASTPRNWKPLLTGLGALILLAGLGYGAFAGFKAWQAHRQAAADAAAKAAAQAALAKAALKPTPLPTAAPTAVPTPGGSLHRERATAAREDEPLPSQLPPTTPQAAGQLDPL